MCRLMRTTNMLNHVAMLLLHDPVLIKVTTVYNKTQVDMF